MIRIISKLTKMGTAVFAILLVAYLSMRPVASSTAFSTSAKKETIKPCDDFYGHVCGKLMGVANSEQSQDPTTVAKAKVAKYLRKAVKGTDSYIVKWAKIHFAACMNESALNKIGVHSLAHVVDEASDFGWNILGENPENDWVAVHNAYCRTTGQGALLNVEVGPDKNFKRNVVFVSPTEELFLPHVSKSNPEDIYQYVDFLTDIWTAYANDQGHPTYSRKSVQNAIRDVLNFRQMIIEKRNLLQSISNITAMTLSDLDEHTRRIMEKKNLDWPRFLQSIFQPLENFQFNKSTVVYIRGYNNMKNTLRAIESAPVKVLLNHIHLHFLERFIQHTSVNMTARFHQVVKRPLPKRSITCVSGNAMKKIVNFLYAEKLLTKYTTSTVLVITHNVQKMLIGEIKRTSWIDQRARDIVVSKLNDLGWEFGYNMWQEYRRKLFDVYCFRMTIRNNYLGNVLDFETMSYRDTLRRLWSPVNQDEFITQLTDPFDVNAAAAYNYRTNTLMIPPALLKHIQLSKLGDLQHDITYGAFGTILGYSLSRSLDSLGRQYDRTGKRRNRWGPTTLTEYNKHLQCYLEIFQKTSLRAGLSFAQVDRNDYQDEIVAEYIGLVAALEANKRANPSHAESEASSGFHSNFYQIFFHAYAARQCRAPIGTDARLPHGLRVNTALSNMRPFADAFGCKKTDRMYSSKKCKWLDESQI